MEKENCMSDEQIQKLIQKLQGENSFYKKETIERAIKTCCELNKDSKNEKSLEDCVRTLTKQYHLM